MTQGDQDEVKAVVVFTILGNKHRPLRHVHAGVDGVVAEWCISDL